jgi:hypothetical protein
MESKVAKNYFKHIEIIVAKVRRGIKLPWTKQIVIGATVISGAACLGKDYECQIGARLDTTTPEGPPTARCYRDADEIIANKAKPI